MVHGQLHIRNTYARIRAILSVKDNRIVLMFINLFKQGLLILNIPHDPLVTVKIYRYGWPFAMPFSLHELIIGFIDIACSPHDGLPRNMIWLLPFRDRFRAESTIDQAHIVHDTTSAAVTFKTNSLFLT